MRALCEGCGKPQPPDWQAGDLCSFCGRAVRHDVRCYWCAKWVPAAKFCRSCGATVVDERLYGAARMLKDAGTDRFTIPKQLVEFDPDQIENFSRIYQRHSIAVARHVDEVRFLERFLFHKSFSGTLEDLLVPQLPWPEETLARMSAPRILPGNDLATVQAIFKTTPFGETRALASLVRLQLRDGDAYKEACSVFYSGDPGIRAEAALQLTGWRIVYSWGRPRNLDRELTEELQKSSHRLEAAVRLGLMGRREDDLLKEALSSSDDETAFAAALVLGDVDRLQAAMKGDDQQKSAAGSKLISLGIIKPVVEPIRKSTREVQWELVESLARRKEPAPEAAEMLLEIVETTNDDTLRERASRILCRELNPGWVLRIARKAGKERSIYQNLLQAPGLHPDSAAQLGDFLIEQKQFTMNQYGLSHVAEAGLMPLTFVPTRFIQADQETRKELLRFAESQLQKEMDEGLHRFLMNVVFGPFSHEIRAAAWWSLYRTYRHHGEHRGEGPFKLQKDAIVRFFGSVGAFVPNLASVLRDPATLKEVGYYEMMANLLNSADDAAAAAMQAEEGATDDLLAALCDALRGDFWPYTLEAMMNLLSKLGSHPRWQSRALEGLRALDKKGNYHYDKAIRRLELSAHGIPEESEWDALPLDFAPSRFGRADAAGRRELLKVVEHQLIHKKTDEPDPGLGRLLLNAALSPDETDLRREAMKIHADRMRRSRFAFSKPDVERYFGSFSEFLPLAASTIRDPALMKEPRFLEFFDGLFENPQASIAELIAAEGDAGLSLLRAMLEFAGNAPGEGRQVNLRRSFLRWLEKIAPHPAWRDEVFQGLDRLRSRPGFDLESELTRIIRALRPVEPAKPAHRPAPAHPREEGAPLEPPPAVIDYAEKGRLAQQLGIELQQAIFRLMSGPASPEEKMREATRMSEEYQAKIKALYNS